MGTSSNTIAAIATPQGQAGIGVVRVSGKDLAWLAIQLLGKAPTPRVATRSEFVDAEGEPIDSGIAILFRGPASYTGEDVLELQGHGGPVVLQMLLRRCLELGARLAEPGEFTRRAFLNDKIDLAQAESVADLIGASSERAARCALRSLRGDFSAVIEDLARELVELRMLVEATLDFPEEEVDTIHRDDALARLDRLSEKVSQALRGGRQGGVLRSGLQVVLAGQPNVGKSSILNRLAGEEVAIVTDIPGTTRDAVRQTIQVEGVPMHIIDTAGLRETVDRIEKIGIQRSWDAMGKADVLLYVVDACAGPELAGDTVMSRLPQNLKRVIVFNKIDLSGDRSSASEDPTGWTVYLSARTGEGIEGLRRTLLGLAGWQSGSEDVFMARERHLVALERVSEALLQARQQLARSELLAEDLRLAQGELNLVTGEFTSDDLLGEIFSRFCIGK